MDKCLYRTRDVAQVLGSDCEVGTQEGTVKSMHVPPTREKHHMFCPWKWCCFSESLPRDLDWFEKVLSDKFEGKPKGRLTHPGEEMRVLNRIVWHTADGYKWEADQRHAEIFAPELGLTPEPKPAP